MTVRGVTFPLRPGTASPPPQPSAPPPQPSLLAMPDLPAWVLLTRLGYTGVRHGGPQLLTLAGTCQGWPRGGAVGPRFTRIGRLRLVTLHVREHPGSHVL